MSNRTDYGALVEELRCSMESQPATMESLKENDEPTSGGGFQVFEKDGERFIWLDVTGPEICELEVTNWYLRPRRLVLEFDVDGENAAQYQARVDRELATRPLVHKGSR